MTPIEALTLLTALVPTQRESKAHRVLREFIEANTPWYPPQQEGYGPWVEYRNGDPGPRVNDVVMWLTPYGRENREGGSTAALSRLVRWERVVAYCVKDKP